ncbi:hypothetical protein PAMA_000733 [Pampus argenteus]
MPRFVSQPAPSTVHLGNSQVMACEVNSDLVPFTRWEKDRQPLEMSNRLVLLPSGALVVSNATEADAGLYRCLVENVGSSKSSDEAQLQIQPETGEERKLEFLLQPASVTKMVGASVLLPCVASGYPAPHVRWMFDEKLLEESLPPGGWGDLDVSTEPLQPGDEADEVAKPRGSSQIKSRERESQHLCSHSSGTH